MSTEPTRWICKRCGARSPDGIGYVGPATGPLPAPDPDCDQLHHTDNEEHQP